MMDHSRTKTEIFNGYWTSMLLNMVGQMVYD